MPLAINWNRKVALFIALRTVSIQNKIELQKKNENKQKSESFQLCEEAVS